MTTDLATVTPSDVAPPPADDPDDALVDLWLQVVGERSPHTRRAYRADAQAFRAFVGKPLRSVTLQDLVNYRDSLVGAGSSRQRRLAAVRSLFHFAHTTGYATLNVSAALRMPTVHRERRSGLSEREVQRLILAAEKRSPRDGMILALLYYSAARLSDVTAGSRRPLRWRDVVSHPDGSATLLFRGKGDKDRRVTLPSAVAAELLRARPTTAADDTPVVATAAGRPLSDTQLRRIVTRAAQDAGIAGVSPHWFRHAHATHAARRGCSLRVVQVTLGHANVNTTAQYLDVEPEESSSFYLGR